MTRAHVHTSDCQCHKPWHTWLKIFVALAFLSLVMAGVAHAQDDPQPQQMPSQPQQRPQGRVVRLRFVEGDVQVLVGDQTEFSNAVANMPLQQGTVVQTGTNGKAEVQFEDGSIARIVPGSQLALSGLSGGDIGSLQTSLELRAGTGYFEVEPTGNDVFTVTAGGLQIAIPNKGSFRVDLNGTAAQVSVADGSIQVQTQNGGEPATVAANQTLTEGDNGVNVATGTASEPFDQWNEDRDNQLQQEAANTTQSQQGGDATGWADLDYYGDWYPVPGVGPVWQPYGYGDDFDPFAGGYWATYGWGDTWISAYPWGWTPFHCGYWSFYGGFGWGWAPGGCGVGIWYPYPPVYHRPPGWRFPFRPRTSPVGRGKLFPVGKVSGGGVRVLPAHPSPHRPDAPVVSINGHQVRPVLTVPRQVGPGQSHMVGSGINQRGPAPAGDAPRQSGGSPWHGSAPMPPREQPHFSAPPRAPAAPSHSSPPPASHSGGGSSHK